jgi:hypothetical protein
LRHLGGRSARPRNAKQRFPVVSLRKATNGEHPKGGVNRMSILWIILIVVLVLALLGFFSRGYW